MTYSTCASLICRLNNPADGIHVRKRIDRLGLLIYGCEMPVIKLTPQQVRLQLALTLIIENGGPIPHPNLAVQTRCSERALRRDFDEVFGITPREYGQLVRMNQSRQLLRGSLTVSDAIFSAGYGSVRAFYEQAAKRLGMTPTQYAQGAPDHALIWSTTQTQLGTVIAVASPRGLCSVRIGSEGELIVQISAEFHQAKLIRDEVAMVDVMRALRLLADSKTAPSLPIDVAGTAFQARVWKALREIPRGETRTYKQVAEVIGEPTAVRAVARACAANPVALTVPCHRVIRGDGSLAGYRWGLEVKEQLLKRECIS